MRIVITHPFCWPHVRRGSERQIEIIAGWLGERGHQITYLSTHPEGERLEEMPYGRRVLARPVRGIAPLRIDERHTFLWTTLSRLGAMDAQIVHSFYFTDSLAASLARPRNRYRTVLQLHGLAVPGVSCRRFLPPEGFMLGQALRRADGVVTCSGFVARQMEEVYGVKPAVVHSAVHMESWPLGDGPEQDRPVILSVGDFTVRRKGGRPLVAAFSRLLEECPEAVLRLSGRMSRELECELRELAGERAARSIEFLGLGAPEDLPRHYQQASILAMPSMAEPSGGAMMEALASGAPVVAARHGGLPEYLDPGTSVLVEPGRNGEELDNIEGLTEGLLQGIRMSRVQGIRERCRRHAERFSVQALGAGYEELYAAIQ